MESVAVSVEGVSKKYRLYNSPKERLWEALHPFNKKYHRDFWALNNISLEVPTGSTVGIIGRNGSGKSTLLEIICSVLRPTTGAVAVNGRISTLLGLGAGFNPEFTGRENVFLNGAVMGYSPQEMNMRLPQIEAFADIGEFINQPLKIYSTGMFMRLAFACAINVEPDIVVIDEVLAVGDAKFQRKCYQKFAEFQEAAKTIIFVTHDIGSIVKHCSHAVLLDNGHMILQGKPKDVVNRYREMLEMDEAKISAPVSASETSPSAQDLSLDPTTQPGRSELARFLEEAPTEDRCIHRKTYNENEYRYGDKRGQILDYLVVCGDRYDPLEIASGETIELYSKVKFFEHINSPTFGFGIKTIDGITIFANNTRYLETRLRPIRAADILILKLSIALNLKAGDYFISFGIGEENKIDDTQIDARHDIIHLSIIQKEYFEGFVNLSATFQEITRKRVAPPSAN